VRAALRRAALILGDPRWLLTLTAATVTALLLALSINAVTRSNAAEKQAAAALATRDQTAASAARRVDMLQAQIGELQDQLRVTSADASAERADLIARIEALSAQITRLGQTPVVTVTTTTRPAPTTTAAPAQRPPVPTTRPAPATTTTTANGHTCSTAGPVRICPGG